MSAAEFMMSFVIPYIPLLALIIGFWMFFSGSKEPLEQKFSEQLKGAETYPDIKKSITSISRKNFHVLLWYLLYFIIIIPILVHFFGKIKYGPNIPYTLFLVMVGIPFLISFMHILVVVDNQRCRLIASGLSIKEGSMHVSKWILLTLSIMIFVISVILKLANLFF
jgi:hypothetical protein